MTAAAWHDASLVGVLMPQYAPHNPRAINVIANAVPLCGNTFAGAAGLGDVRPRAAYTTFFSGNSPLATVKKILGLPRRCPVPSET